MDAGRSPAPLAFSVEIGDAHHEGEMRLRASRRFSADVSYYPYYVRRLPMLHADHTDQKIDPPNPGIACSPLPVLSAYLLSIIKLGTIEYRYNLLQSSSSLS